MTAPRARRWVATAVVVGFAGAALTGCAGRAPGGSRLPAANAEMHPLTGVLVASESNDSVLALDPTSLRTTAVVPLGTAFPGQKLPHELAVTPDRRTLLVTEYGYHALALVDIGTHRLVAEIPVGSGPHGVAVSPDGRFAYVAASNDKLLSVVDLRRRLLVAQVPTPLLPWDVVLAPDGRTAWVTTLGDQRLVRVDLVRHRVLRTVDLHEAYVVAGAQVGRHLVVGGHFSNRLFVLDVATGAVLSRPSLGGGLPAMVAESDSLTYFCKARPGSGPMPVAMARAGASRLLVVEHGTDDLAVLHVPDLRVSARVPLGDNPQGVVASPDGRIAFASVGGLGELLRVDLTTGAVTARALTGPRPIGVLFLGG